MTTFTVDNLEVATINGSAPLVNPATTKGDLLIDNGTALVRLPVGTDGQVLTARSTAPDGADWEAAGAASIPITTKGDLVVGNSSGAPVRLGVGADGDVITADSTQADGVKWAPPGGSGGTVTLAGYVEGSGTGTVDTILAGPEGHRYAVTLAPTITNPVTQMTWDQVKQTREISPFASGLPVSIDYLTQDSGQYTITSGVSDAYGPTGLSINGGAATLRMYQNQDNMPIPCMSAAVHVVTQGAGVGDFLRLDVGFGTDQNNYLHAMWEVASGLVYCGQLVAGALSYGNQVTIAQPTGNYGLCLTMSGSNYIVWVDMAGNGNWYPVLIEGLFSFNTYSQAELKQFHPQFGATGGTMTNWVISSFKTGMQGQTFLRDFRQVTLKDGTPYSKDGYNYFTATNDHCAVWRVNFTTYHMEKVGILLTSNAGTVYFDLNFDLVFDPDINGWHVLSVNWGDNLSAILQIRHTVFHGEILHGVNILPRGTPLALTGNIGGANGTYEPSLIWNPATSLWTLAYVIASNNTFVDYYPAVDSSPDLTTWTNVWNAGSGTVEGSCICKIGGEYYVTGGNGGAFIVWTLSGTGLGDMNVTTFPNPGGSNPPHFVVFSTMQNDVTSYYALSWQNTPFSANGVSAGHNYVGTPIIYKAEQTQVGYEFDAVGAA